VTGYDFPELVDNGGKALVDELNIQKVTFRKKIVRLVNARMLGIGSKPREPFGVKIDLEGCSTAILKWKRPEAEGFPVHKFRVQRRRLSSNNDIPSHSSNSKNRHNDVSNNVCFNSRNEEKIFEDENTNTSIDRALIPDFKISLSDDDKLTCPSAATVMDSSKSEKIIISDPVKPNPLQWQNICDNSIPECHDFGLERGHKGYQYRIQAWNAVGKSDWVLAEMKSWGRNRCDRIKNKQKSIDNHHTPSIFGWFIFVWRLLYSFSNIMMGFLGVFVTIVKIKRASTNSTATKIEPIFPWLLKAMNALVKAIIGVDVSPQILWGLGTENSANTSYDVTVNSVGLMGYEKAKSEGALLSPPPQRKASSKPLPFESKSEHKQKEINRSVILKDEKRFSKRNLLSPPPPPIKAASTPLPSESNFDKTPKDINKSVELKKETRFSNRTLTITEKVLPRADGEHNINKDPPARSLVSDSSPNDNEQDHNNAVTVGSYDRVSSIASHDGIGDCDDHCIVCKKRYKFGKRKKHHCSICYSTFCHKHGKTTHSNFIPCKVPGDCVCNNCIVTD
jgi:hypothetical protein